MSDLMEGRAWTKLVVIALIIAMGFFWAFYLSWLIEFLSSFGGVPVGKRIVLSLLMALGTVTFLKANQEALKLIRGYQIKWQDH